MKKLFLSIFAILSVLIFSSCFGKPYKVVSFFFYVDDGPVAPQYYSEANMTVTPNYEDRNLSVDFSVRYPNRTEETLENDFSTTGVVGGEFFERFNEITVFVRDYQEPENVESEDILVGGGSFKVTMEDLKGKTYDVETVWSNEDEKFESLRTFYLDVKELLMEEEQV